MFVKVLMIDNMKLIPLSRGKFARVDDEDYTWLDSWKWYCSSSGYAIRTVNDLAGIGGKKTRTIHMHREILRAEELVVDHIDGDPLNNQRSNLRTCTHSQNMWNRRHQVGSKSKLKGVTKNQKSPGYISRITVDNKTIYLGTYGTEMEAHLAYCNAAEAIFEDFSRLG